MDERKRLFRPSADSLEPRIALSAGAAAAPAEVSTLAAAANAHAKRPSIMGPLSGRYLATGQDNRPADGVYEVNVNAHGRVTGLGRVAMTGTIAFGGFRPAGQPDVVGTVTLANARGSVTVRLTGFGGNGPIPGQRFGLNALIVGATGAYANVRGLGTASALFGQNVVRSVTTPSPIGGNLAFNINLSPPR